MANQNSPGGEEFQDPLENYDPKTYDDPLEQAIAERSVTEIHTRPFASVSPDETIENAVKELAGLHVACLLVVDVDKLVGVFTDRDVLDRVALEYDEIKDRPVREVMAVTPVYVFDSDTAAATLAVMAQAGIRHVPVVDIRHNPLGIVTPHRVTEFLQQHAPEA